MYKKVTRGEGEGENGKSLMAAVSVQNEENFWPWIVVMAAQPPMRSCHCIAHVKMVKIASFDMHVTYTLPQVF